MPRACSMDVLDTHHLVAEVGIAASRQLGLGGQHGGVERGQLAAQLGVERAQVDPLGSQADQPLAQPGDLPSGGEHLQATQLTDQCAVAARRLGLALQRAELAAHLAEQVLDTQQAGLGGIETPLGLLLAPPVLEDAGGLLDDRAAVFRPGLEHRVDVALVDDACR